jgi:hypothetical protein
LPPSETIRRPSPFARTAIHSPIHSKFPGGLSVGSLTAADNYYPQTITGTVTCAAGGCIGGWIQPKGGLYNRDNNNFQPRIGFAWNVANNTVIRGGYASMTLDKNLWYTNQNEAGGPATSAPTRSASRPTFTHRCSRLTRACRRPSIRRRWRTERYPPPVCRRIAAR